MLNKQEVSQLLKVDFSTGKLMWIDHLQRPDLIGRRAGHINNGYWRLSILGHEVYACQIVWLLFYGEWPSFTIDHKDNDGLNDSIGNLREATKAQNAANSVIRSDNKSGYKGVSYCRVTGKWRASIRIAGREKNLGRYTTPEAAHEAWLAAAVEARGAEFVRAS